MNELKIRLDIPTEIAKICCESIGIETKSSALSRSKIDLGHGKDCLKIDINSQDLSAMRAALNTYLRWVIMCCDLLKINKV